MRTKRFLVLILALVIACVFSFGAYAASGQGYFGTNTDNSYEVEEDYDDEDYDDEERDEPINVPVQVPKSQQQNAPKVEDNEIHANTNYWEGKSFKPEKKSTNASKVIQSYRLDGGSAHILLDKHKSAGNSAIGKREQSMRYTRIFSEYPYDYFAAYKVAEMNYDMGRYSTALKWIEISIDTYSEYVPAKHLKTKINAALKRTR